MSDVLLRAMALYIRNRDKDEDQRSELLREYEAAPGRQAEKIIMQVTNITSRIADAAADLKEIPSGYIKANLSTTIYEAQQALESIVEQLDEATNE